MALETILFLGDSLTLGTPGWPSAAGGWRGEVLRAMPGLFPTGQLLTNPVWPYDGAGNALSTSKIAHDGHSGLSAAHIITILPGIWDVAAAQRVTILLGANAISTGDSPTKNAADIATIIDYILGRSPAVRFWVSAGTTNWRSDQTAYNPILDAQRPLVRQVSAARPSCTSVEMPHMLDSDFDDTIHLNAGGYTKIAGVWIAALRAA